MQITGGATLKTPPKGKQQTAADVALAYLQRNNSVDFDSGFSAAEIAKATHYSRSVVSDCLQKLLDKKIVTVEKQKTKSKYFLPTQRSNTEP